MSLKKKLLIQKTHHAQNQRVKYTTRPLLRIIKQKPTSTLAERDLVTVENGGEDEGDGCGGQRPNGLRNRPARRHARLGRVARRYGPRRVG